MNYIVGKKKLKGNRLLKPLYSKRYNHCLIVVEHFLRTTGRPPSTLQKIYKVDQLIWLEWFVGIENVFQSLWSIQNSRKEKSLQTKIKTMSFLSNGMTRGTSYYYLLNIPMK
nr:unnamed protein product [Callosobruchus analis]